MQYNQNINVEPYTQPPVTIAQNFKLSDGFQQRYMSNSIHDYHVPQIQQTKAFITPSQNIQSKFLISQTNRIQKMKGDNHEIESIISQVYQRKQDLMQNQTFQHSQNSFSNTTNQFSKSKQLQNLSQVYSNGFPLQNKIQPWDSQGSLDGGQQVNLDDYIDPEEVPQYDQMHIQQNALLSKTQKVYTDFSSPAGARGYHDPVVKKIVYNGNTASLKRVDKIQEKVQSILNHRRERSDQLEIKFPQNKKIINSYCTQIQQCNQMEQLKRNESNKHKNILINENMNAMPNHQTASEKRNINSAKKGNEYPSSIRYLQEPKEVVVDLASNSNKTKNYPTFTKLKSTSNHVARSSSTSKKDANQSFNNLTKINNQITDLNQNNSGTLLTSSSSNNKQFQTPIKKMITISNKNYDSHTEKRIRDKSLTEQGSARHNFKTPIKSENIVLKQKNTNTQQNVKVVQSPQICNDGNRQNLKESNHQHIYKNNNQQGYDTERVLRPYTAQTPAKKPVLTNHNNTPLAIHMSPDSGIQTHASTLNQQNSCSQNDLFDTHVSIQQYRIEGELGKGSYATVKMGIDKTNGEQYALKIYQKFTLTDPNKMRNVKREISILKRLSHPNIIKMPYAFQDKNTIVLVMECLSRLSLHSYLKKKQDRRVPESEAKMIFHQLVSGVDYCHLRNIVHRDIKLENIMVEENSKTVKIIDFGFSICTGIKLKIFCGTPTYMAPEIVSKIDYCGKKADIWALGIVLFVLLCGKFPFRGMSDSELFKKIRSCVYDPPQNASEKCIQLLRKLLKFNPSDRPDCYEVRIY